MHYRGKKSKGKGYGREGPWESGLEAKWVALGWWYICKMRVSAKRASSAKAEASNIIYVTSKLLARICEKKLDRSYWAEYMDPSTNY